MSAVRIAAVSAAFDRDLDRTLAQIEALIRNARSSGVNLLVLPEEIGRAHV